MEKNVLKSLEDNNTEIMTLKCHWIICTKRVISKFIWKMGTTHIGGGDDNGDEKKCQRLNDYYLFATY